MSRKVENAKALYKEGIQDGNARAAITKYSGHRYTQHSTPVRDGIEGFVEFFTDFLARNPIRDIQIVRAWEDGNCVFLHAFQSLNNGETKWVTTDFFDTDEDDKLIEHWDVIAEYSDSTPSGHTSVDGPTEVTDLHRTDANKAVVRSMIENLLMPGGAIDTIDQYIASDYIQHNAQVADGMAPFRLVLASPDESLWYHEIVLLVGKGNFVATLCRATRGEQECAQVDIFRLEDGLIVEHWDCVEAVPPQSEWVNSGKF